MSGVDLVAAVSRERVLVLDGVSGPALPAVAGGDGWPDTPLVIRTVGVAAATVLAPAARLGSEPTTTVHLLGLAPGCEPWLDDAGWLDLADLDRLAHPSGVAAAIRTGLGEYSGEAPWPRGRPDWYRPGWQAEVEWWVDEQLPALGLARTGKSESVKIWSLSAVLRIPVASGEGATSVFVKATCPHFRAEPAITRLMASLAPEVVSEVLATNDARIWTLMRPLTEGEVEGRPETAPAAARAMARLQLQLLASKQDLLATGAPDRRLVPTLAAFEQLVTDSIELPKLDGLERQQAVMLLPWVASEFDALAAIGVPDSIAHGDLHLGNYVADAADVRIFDWSDGALTCPVFDAVMLAQSAGSEHEQAIFEAYAEVWAGSLPELDVAAALRLAAVPHLVYLAVSFEGIYRGQEEQARWEMAGISVRLLRRLIARWSEAGSPS